LWIKKLSYLADMARYGFPVSSCRNMIANIKFAVDQKQLEPRVFAIIQAAGWPIWPLLLASILAVAFIIERSLALRRSKVVPDGLLQSIVAEYRQGGVNEDMIQRVARHSPLGRVLSAGLRNVKSTREAMKESIYNAGFGILIAIPAMIFYRYFRALVDGFVVEMEQQAIKLVELVHGQRAG
jgi:biopolymer transport protein ExbB/TolQ